MFCFSSVRFTFSAVRRFQDILLPESGVTTTIKSCNRPLLEPFFVLPVSTRKIKICHSLSGEKLDENDQTQKNKRKVKDLKVSVTMENNTRSYMYKKELEKYARRNNLNVVFVGTDNKERPMYELQKISSTFEDTNLKKGKGQKSKNILLRGEISQHDLEVKVNQVLKFIEKDVKVVCVIEGNNTGKQEEFLKKLTGIDPQKYCVRKVQSGNHLRLIFEPKSTEVRKKSETNEENVNAVK